MGEPVRCDYCGAVFEQAFRRHRPRHGIPLGTALADHLMTCPVRSREREEQRRRELEAPRART